MLSKQYTATATNLIYHAFYMYKEVSAFECCLWEAFTQRVGFCVNECSLSPSYQQTLSLLLQVFFPSPPSAPPLSPCSYIRQSGKVTLPFYISKNKSTTINVLITVGCVIRIIVLKIEFIFSDNGIRLPRRHLEGR